MATAHANRIKAKEQAERDEDQRKRDEAKAQVNARRREQRAQKKARTEGPVKKTAEQVLSERAADKTKLRAEVREKYGSVCDPGYQRECRERGLF